MVVADEDGEIMDHEQNRSMGIGHEDEDDEDKIAAEENLLN